MARIPIRPSIQIVNTEDFPLNVSITIHRSGSNLESGLPAPGQLIKNILTVLVAIVLDVVNTYPGYIYCVLLLSPDLCRDVVR